MTIMRLTLCLISVVVISGCMSTGHEKSPQKEKVYQSTMTPGAEALQQRLIQQCAEDIRQGKSDDDNVLRCYSRKIKQLVDLARKELSKEKVQEQ